MNQELVNSVSSDVIKGYLARPYRRLFIPESDGSYRAEIVEFPGCIAVGDTPVEALSNLEEVAEEWLGYTISRGQPIPEPVECNEYSGKLVLRMPRSLHKKAAGVSMADGVSLNQLIVAAVAEYIGERAKPSINNLFFTSSFVPVKPFRLDFPSNSQRIKTQALDNPLSVASSSPQGFLGIKWENFAYAGN